jgi:hypothetical protein
MLAPLAALILAAAARDTSWGAIRGTVESDPSGLPLPAAVVEVAAGAQTLTDSTGTYRLAHVAAGEQTVRVHSLDHEPLEVQVFVPARGEVVVDVSLRHRPLALSPVSAVGASQGGVETDPAPRGEAAITDFPALEGPGTGLDPGHAPAGSGGSGGDVLLVRGSAANLKLVLLDGAPVYAPFHMGGLIDSFDPGLLSSARLYLGGAPARYDGGVSYVLDLATRAPSRERWSGAAAADLVAVRGQVGGPLWKGAALLLAGRGVHGATLARLEGQPFPYAYGDGLARLDVDLGAGASVSATGFANAEGVRIDTQPWRDNFLRWSNDAGSVRLRGPVAGAQGELTAATSDFDAWLPNAAERYVIQSHLKRARVALDLTHDGGGNVRMGYGYAYDRLWAHHRVLDRRAGERIWFTRDTFATVGGWYVDALWRSSPQWVVRGGLRGDMYAGGPFISFSPRLSLTWLMARHASLTLAGGRYHQLVLARTRPPFDYGVTDVADSLGIPTVPVVASSSHLALSLDQELVPGLRLGLEGYWKHFEDIPDPDQVGNYASGVDVWVRRGEGPISGWMGYALAWYWTRAGTPQDTSRFSGRQTLSAGLTAQGRPGKVELRVAYGSGLPYSSLGTSTSPDGVASAPGSIDLQDGTTAVPGAAPQDFLRIDGQVSRTFTPRIASHPTELTPYVRVINALDRRDALFYRYHPGDEDARPVATLPILPVFGVEWKF